MLHQGSGSPAVLGLQPPELLVAAVVLLNEHSCSPALLELLLLVVAAKFTLDKDGGLRHLLVKCILWRRRRCITHNVNEFGSGGRGTGRLRVWVQGCNAIKSERFAINPAAGGGKPLPSRLSMLACKTEKGKKMMNDALI